MTRRLLTGNEAIALGAYQAGVAVAAAYPGTPSTEILENLARYPDVYCEWSVNEKVALDVAIGAAYGGVRALAAMKHVGLNVAADSLFYAVYTGLGGGGLVIVTADDPGLHSSQNEQDNRHYARFAKLPMLEPADAEEARRMVLEAFEISERFDTPVLLRTTTRISHSRSAVYTEGERLKRPRGRFRKDPAQFVMIPGFARARHRVVEERLAAVAAWADEYPGNVREDGEGSLGVVTAGVSYQHLREIRPDLPVLKLGMVWPLPEKTLAAFAERYPSLVVVEELDPFLETELRARGYQVVGKEYFPLLGELNPRLVRHGLGLLGLAEDRPETVGDELPARPPVLCPGCGHRGVFQVLRTMKATVLGDIGCYSLGVMPPLSAIDTVGCMGAGIAVAHGMEKAGGERQVAIIGDSTFFHSGLAPLLNLVYNNAHTPVIILDNRTTAMTGHQDHPGTGKTLRGTGRSIDLAALVRAMGVENVREVDPFDQRGLRQSLRQAWESGEPTVIIARHPCVLQTRERHPVPIVTDACNDCGVCLGVGCPGLYREGGRVHIDPALCTGCNLCAAYCGRHAIVPGVEE